MQQANGDVAYAISNFGKRFVTNPFLVMDDAIELTTHEVGQLVVPIKQEISEFSEAAQQFVQQAAEAIGETTGEVLVEDTLYIVGDALDGFAI